MLPMRSMLPFYVLLLAACVEQSQAAAQGRIDLKYPPPRISSTETTVTAGDVIRFRWETTWPTVTVQLWQGTNKKGSMSHMNLLSKWVPVNSVLKRLLMVFS